MLTPTASNRFSTSKVIMKTLIETMIAKSDDKFVTHNMKCSNTGHVAIQVTILSPHICIILLYM